MGVLRIETSGSFPYRAKHFGAVEWGHAHAVAEAIEWLASEVLPAAIAQDHRLQEQGAKPRLGFEGRMGATRRLQDRSPCPRCGSTDTYVDQIEVPMAGDMPPYPTTPGLQHCRACEGTDARSFISFH